jgi:uncharacterized protein YdeI (BOF family)
MKTMLTRSVLGALLTLGLSTAAFAAQGQAGSGPTSGQASPDPGTQSGTPAKPLPPGPIISPKTAGHTETIEGELLRIDKDAYVLKDLTGKEVRLTVDKDTTIDGNIVLHDQVVARATAMEKKHATGKWRAESIKKR